MIKDALNIVIFLHKILDYMINDQATYFPGASRFSIKVWDRLLNAGVDVFIYF